MALHTGFQVCVAMEFCQLGRVKSTAAMESVHVLTNGVLHKVLFVQFHNGHVCQRGQCLEKRNDCPRFARFVATMGTKLPHPWTSRKDGVHTATEVWDATTV